MARLVQVTRGTRLPSMDVFRLKVARLLILLLHLIGRSS
jgi:hypothetical protein